MSENDYAETFDWPAIVEACRALVRVYDDPIDMADAMILGSFLGRLISVLPTTEP